MQNKSFGVISIPMFLFTILLMSEYSFFMLIPNTTIVRGLAYAPWFAFLIILILLMLSKLKIRQKNELNKYILAFILLNILSFIWIYKQYLMVDSTAFSALFYALSILIYYPTSNLKKNHDLYSILTIVNIVAISMIMIQTLYFDVVGHTLIPSFSLDKVQMRNGIRIIYYDLMITLSFSVSATRIFGLNKNKKLHILNCLLSLIYLFFVSQTRYSELICLFILSVIVVKKVFKDLKYGKINIGFLFLVPFVIMAVAFLMYKVYIAVITPILNNTYMNMGSYFARVGELQYYSNVIKEHPLLGLGNFNTTSSSYLWTMIHGQQGFFYTQDIGLIGDIARLGILIFVYFLFLMFTLLKKRYRVYQNIGLFIFIGSSLGSISIFTNGLILGLALALLEEKNDEEIEYNNSHV